MPNQRPSPVQPPAGRERRRSPRAQADRPLTVLVEGAPREVRLRDLSASGLCFFAEQPLPEMTALQIALDLPRGGGQTDRVEASGAVVRCQPISPRLEHYEIAVFFHDISPENRQHLERFVDANP